MTTRLRLLERLLARRSGSDQADVAPATPVTVSRLLIIGERLGAILGALGLVITIIVGLRASGTDFGWVGWSLLGLSVGLLVVGTLLAAGAGRWDGLVRRRPANTISARDRWTTLIAAILLISAATIEMACFQALIDGRATAQTQDRTDEVAP